MRPTRSVGGVCSAVLVLRMPSYGNAMGHTKKKETTTPSTIRPQDFKKRKGHLEGYCELRSAAASPNSRPLPTTFLSTREGTSLPIKRNSTYICEHVNSLASKSTSSLALKGNSMFLDNLKLRSHLCPQAPPPPSISHPHQLHDQPAYGPRHIWLP